MSRKLDAKPNVHVHQVQGECLRGAVQAVPERIWMNVKSLGGVSLMKPKARECSQALSQGLTATSLDQLAEYILDKYLLGIAIPAQYVRQQERVLGSEPARLAVCEKRLEIREGFRNGSCSMGGHSDN
jgi:hypothetical protein